MFANIDHEFTRDFAIGELNGEIPSAANAPGAHRQVIPQFFTMAEKDEGRSLALGRAAFREIEMVRILIPGDKGSAPERRVTPEIKQRFPRQYEAFKKQLDFVPDGTLIDTWPPLSKSQIYDLKSANIFTVEQLAGLSDEQISAIGLGGKTYRRLAQTYLENSEKGKHSMELVAENQSLKDQVALLTSQISDLARRMEQMMVKAGENPADASSPVLAARAATAAALKVDTSIHVPENYTQLGFPKLREIVASIGNIPVRSKEEALEVIAEYLGKKAAVTA